MKKTLWVVGMLAVVGSVAGCDGQGVPTQGAANELRGPVVGRGGIPDDTIKPKPIVSQGGIPDDSIKPKPLVGRGGIPDDTIKPKPTSPAAIKPK